MNGAVLIGPGLPGKVAGPARAAFAGEAFRAHVELADRLGLPIFVATPRGPVPADSPLHVHRRWPAEKLTAAVVPWAAASEHLPIVVLADDAQASTWRRAVGAKVLAPLLGLTATQRTSLARLVAAGQDLPSWAPTEIVLLHLRAAEKAAQPALLATTAPADDPRRDVPGRKEVISYETIEREAAMQRLLYPEAASLQRPRTRGDCVGGPRPCPWVGCRYNLFLEVTKDGAIAPRNPKTEPWDVHPARSCVLDIVDQNPAGMLLADVGDIIELTRERIRQIERAALQQGQEEVTMTREEVRELGAGESLWDQAVREGA